MSYFSKYTLSGALVLDAVLLLLCLVEEREGQRFVAQSFPRVSVAESRGNGGRRVVTLTEEAAAPPFCRCLTTGVAASQARVCANDGMTYTSICDLVNSIASTPGLGYRCKGDCPCSFNFSEFVEGQKKTFHGTFAACLTNGSTVRSPFALQAALVFTPSVGVRSDLDCDVGGRDGPWRCPSYYGDVPPHSFFQERATRPPLLPTTPKKTTKRTSTKKPAIVINIGGEGTSKKPTTKKKEEEAAVKISLGEAAAEGEGEGGEEGGQEGGEGAEGAEGGEAGQEGAEGAAEAGGEEEENEKKAKSVDKKEESKKNKEHSPTVEISLGGQNEKAAKKEEGKKPAHHG